MTSEPLRKGAAASEADALQQFASQQEFAFADVAPDGAIRSLNPFARLCWGWAQGGRVPQDVLFLLEGMPLDASEVLPLSKGDLVLHGVRRGTNDGWMLIGYEELEHAMPEAEPGGFDSLVRQMPVAVFRMRTDGTVAYANEEAERLTGYPQTDIVGGKFWTRVLVAEHLPIFESAIRSVTRRRSEDLVISYRDAEGRVRQGQLHLFFSETYVIEAVLLAPTVGHAAGPDYAVLSPLEKRPEGFLFVDAVGMVSYANQRVRELIDIVTVDGWMQHVVEDAPGFDRTAAVHIRRCLDEGVSFSRVESAFTTSSGSVCHVFVSGTPSYEDGERIGCAVQVRHTADGERSEYLKDRFESASNRLRELATSAPDESVFLDAVCRVLGEAAMADRVRVLFASAIGDSPIGAACWNVNAPDPMTTTEQDREVQVVIGDARELYLGPDPTTGADTLGGLLPVSEAHWLRVHNGLSGAFIVIERFPNRLETRSSWTPWERIHFVRLAELAETLWSWIELAHRERRLRDATDDVHFTFALADGGRRQFRHLTDQIEALTGHPARDWGAEHGTFPDWIEEIVHPDDRPTVRAHDRVLEQVVNNTATYRVMHKDGSVRWVEERAMPVPLPGGSHVVQGIMKNLTAQKEAEIRAAVSHGEVASAMRQKTGFVATLSHELRTPIGAVHGYAQLLESEVRDLEAHGLDVPGTIKEFVTAIEDRSRRLVSLVQDLFDLSNIELGQVDVERSPVHLHTVIKRSAGKTATRLRDKGILMKLQLDGSDPKVLGDARRIEQILDGLISNAVKFTREGTITVRTQGGKRDVVIEIMDTGVGIAPEFKAQLFSPFTQEEEWRNRRFDGTGLGLSLVKRLLDMQGGRIEVDSEKDRGSTFRVFLPAVRGTAARGVQLSRAPRA